VQDCTTYIGRTCNMGGWHLAASKWANPYTMRKFSAARTPDLTRAQWDAQERQRVLALYEQHVRESPELLNALHELTGAVMGCWCVGKVRQPSLGALVCHGEVLASLWDERVGTSTPARS
jgi:Domain of unknown function (DUF4326)